VGRKSLKSAIDIFVFAWLDSLSQSEQTETMRFMTFKYTNDPNQQASPADAAQDLAETRANRMSTVGWTAGLSALFACGALGSSPTWPVAFGVAAVALMVGVVCVAIMKYG
jgi:hypothetical protein